MTTTTPTKSAPSIRLRNLDEVEARLESIEDVLDGKGDEESASGWAQSEALELAIGLRSLLDRVQPTSPNHEVVVCLLADAKSLHDDAVRCLRHSYRRSIDSLLSEAEAASDVEDILTCGSLAADYAIELSKLATFGRSGWAVVDG